MQRSRAQVALVFLVALLLRVIGLADFLTADEVHHWITRTERFSAAISGGRWAETILTGHPGVTLMWLASLGLHLERTALAWGWIMAPDRLGHLAWLRLGPVLAHALLISVGFLLLQRLMPRHALLAALLWACSPFLVAHGRLIHLDALLADFCTLSLLAIILAYREPPQRFWLALSSLFCGLALLTKGPALIMLPSIGLSMVALALPPPPTWTWPSGSTWVVRSIMGAIPRYLVWLGMALVVVVALWPALWVVPDQALGRYFSEIIGNGGRANGDGQFFLGRSDADPGPLFYLISSAYRLTPIEWLGLLCIPLFMWHQRGTFDWPMGLVLGGFVLFWFFIMTSGPKKFDRYVLPAWPTLMILAAWGLNNFSAWMRQQRPALRWLSPVLLAFQGVTLAWYHPYYLSYYNPLLGGGQVAQHMFLIGWGEGMDRVGAWLTAQRDINEGQVLSALPHTLQPFLPVPVQAVEALDRANANYAVVYRESLQREANPDYYARIQAGTPLTTITIHGIDYAWIYQLPKAYTTPWPAQFGSGLYLRGYSLSHTPQQLTVTPAWDVRRPIGADLLLFLHLYDSTGTRVAGVDVTPGGDAFPQTSDWRSGQQIAVPIPLVLPADLSTGTYTLVMGLYDPRSGERLPLSIGEAANPGMAGANALWLGGIEIANDS
ncbi:ArnT family glycosyltransferase [Candidatus Oscillochloris fontis]|uniref:ArnT family glycosyltransferase n=1 Tax=Candidatus Oscillochloris fontis TaxID=2496868 RepID=UPI00101B9A6A|nr:glycosyltransferase family 39 protein [Candidatus Oscillochloris fontis]